MVAELLEQVDGHQRIGSTSFDAAANFRGVDEQPIKFKLERRESAEHNVLIFAWHCKPAVSANGVLNL
jgi:hypothetical protein